MKRLMAQKAWLPSWTGNPQDLLVKAASLAPQESPSPRFHHRYVVSKTLLLMNTLHFHVI